MLILWEHFKTKMKKIGLLEQMLHCVKIDKFKKMTLYFQDAGETHQLELYIFLYWIFFTFPHFLIISTFKLIKLISWTYTIFHMWIFFLHFCIFLLFLHLWNRNSLAEIETSYIFLQLKKCIFTFSYANVRETHYLDF